MDVQESNETTLCNDDIERKERHSMPFVLLTKIAFITMSFPRLSQTSPLTIRDFGTSCRHGNGFIPSFSTKGAGYHSHMPNNTCHQHVASWHATRQKALRLLLVIVNRLSRILEFDARKRLSREMLVASRKIAISIAHGSIDDRSGRSKSCICR